MANKTEVAAILAILSAAYPRFLMTEHTVQTYYSLLKDLEVDSLHIAAKRCATTQEFFPTVYELRRAVADTLREAQHIPSAYEAWNEVVKFPKDGCVSQVIEEKLDDHKVQFVILKTQIEWSHPLVEKIARQMGWPDFPNGDNLSTDRAHFFRAYEYALDAALRDCVQLPEVRGYIKSLQAGPADPAIQKGIQGIANKWGQT